MAKNKVTQSLRTNDMIGKVAMIVGVILLAIGAIVTGVTVSGLGWKSVDDAIIVDSGSKDDYSCNSKNECASKVYYQPTVAYMVGGQQYRYTAEHRTDQEYGPGDVVKVYYKASEPAKARFAAVDNAVQAWQISVMVVGAILMALGIWQVKYTKRII